MTKNTNRNRRSQSSKPRNEALATAMRDIRRSSAAEPHRNKARYDRTSAKRDWKRDI